MTSPFQWTDARQALWARVETALEEGRDPLLDPSLRHELDADPALLVATGQLVRRLEVVESMLPAADGPTGTARSRTRSKSFPLRRALGGFAAALLLILALRSSLVSPTASPAGPHVEQASERPRISAARPAVTLTVERIRPSAPLGRTVTLTEVPVQQWTLATHP